MIYVVPAAIIAVCLVAVVAARRGTGWKVVGWALVITGTLALVAFLGLIAGVIYFLSNYH